MTTGETKVPETKAISRIAARRDFAFRPGWQGGRKMKKKIGALLVTVVMAVALLAGPALAQDSDDYGHGRSRGGEEWREHHPNYGYSNGYGYQGQQGPYAYRPQPPWSYGQSRYQSYGYGPQPPWSYAQSRYRHWYWPWEDHDGRRGYNGWSGHHGHDRD
jgi:hypothetical protein